MYLILTNFYFLEMIEKYDKANQSSNNANSSSSNRPRTNLQVVDDNEHPAANQGKSGGCC